MSDTNNNNPTGPSGAKRPLGLNKPRPGFSGGRTTAVVVQKKKRRLVGAPGAIPGAAKTAAPAKEKPAVDHIAEAARKLGLSKEEYVKRQDAIGKAQAEKNKKEEMRRAEEAARQSRAEEDRKVLEAKRIREEEDRKAAQAEAERAAMEAQAAQQQVETEQEMRRDKPDHVAAPEKSALELAGGRVKKNRPQHIKPSRSRGKGGNDGRRRGKLTIVSALAGDDERQRSLASMKRARQREKERRLGGGNAKDKVYREVVVPEAITVADLARRMSERTVDVVKYLMQEGTMATANDVLDADTAQLIVEDFGHTVKRVAESDVEQDFLRTGDQDDEETMK
ncbi:MAG TPA: translation initiation factor IF-2, partial [Hellea balneolensis]|nr:translation initiation factor IF-2 [Hellea balneolensis]